MECEIKEASTGAMQDDIKLIPLDRLGSNATQTREKLRPEAIAEYADKLREGEQLEPAHVFSDGQNYYLAAGFHRREAYRQAGKTEMPCYVSEGGEWDAIQAGIYDNQKHQGERLTLNDKRHNTRLVLLRRPDMSDRQIADLVTLSHSTVAIIRTELESTGQIDQLNKRRGRDGKERSKPAPKGPNRQDDRKSNPADPGSSSGTSSAPSTDPQSPAADPRGDSATASTDERSNPTAKSRWPNRPVRDEDFVIA